MVRQQSTQGAASQTFAAHACPPCTHLSHPNAPPATHAAVRTLDRDSFMGPQQALQYGLIDHIVKQRPESEAIIS